MEEERARQEAAAKRAAEEAALQSKKFHHVNCFALSPINQRNQVLLTRGEYVQPTEPIVYDIKPYVKMYDYEDFFSIINGPSLLIRVIK
ncbi:hypothetical protein AKJ16_DCAP03649 [Drosera capensis]